MYTRENGEIKFSYEIEKMFNSISLRTSYKAKSVKDDTGESQLDDIALSQDEKDIMKEFLADGVYEIFTKLFKITEGVSESIFFDTGIPKSYGGSIKDNEAFNVNLLPAIDKKIERALRYFVLSDWYSSVSLKNDAEENYAKYRRTAIEMNNLTFQLRKPLMS